MEKLKVELSDENAIKIAQGTIIKDENLTIYIELDDHDMINTKLSVGKKINIKLFGDKEGLKIYQGIVKYRLGGLITVGNLSLMVKVQRRKDLKVATNYSTVMTCISHNLEKVVKGSFKDISAGGTCFKLKGCKHDFNVGDIFETIFDTGSSLFFAKYKVLRKVKEDSDTDLYGCQFIELSVEEERLVREFVFKSQLIYRKKMDFKLN